MTISKMFVAAALVMGSAAVVSFAGGDCDSKAAKTSSKASCCATSGKTVKATSADADHCTAATTASAKSCDTDKDATSCSATSKTVGATTTTFKTVKATKADGGCCSMKGKAVKMTSADQVTAPKAPETVSAEK